MKVIVLSSGSKGNTTYIETEKTKVLIDCGNTCKYIKEKLENLNISPENINAILITHPHQDHIKGLPTFIKKYNTLVYLTEKMRPELQFVENYTIINTPTILINDLQVDIIKTSHDAIDSQGFVLSNQNSSVVYITDTGYINKKYYNLLKNRNLYIFESNHDIEMLNNGKYPFHLRKRILSDKGHLSNYDSAKYLSEFIGTNTKYILLAHLSEENNTEELAYETLLNRLNKCEKHIDNIIIAEQNKETELIEIWLK